MNTISDDESSAIEARVPGVGKTGNLTAHRVAFLDRAAEIELEEPGELAFSTDFMTQTSLPISEPSGAYYSRSNGRFKLLITPTFIEIDGVMTACYPYGVYPRRALIWIISEALRTNNPRIEIGATINEFMRKIGLKAGGGQRAKEMRRQLLALLGSPIRTTVSEHRDGMTHDVVASFLIAKEAEIWTENTEAGIGQRPLFESSIELSQEFFQKLKKNGAVPLDMRAIEALGNNAMALDVYTWVTWRNHAARGKNVVVRWDTLKKQFGNDIKDLRYFRFYFLKVLKKVAAVHPGLKYEATTQHFTLCPSAAAVEARRNKPKQ